MLCRPPILPQNTPTSPRIALHARSLRDGGDDGRSVECVFANVRSSFFVDNLCELLAHGNTDWAAFTPHSQHDELAVCKVVAVVLCGAVRYLGVVGHARTKRTDNEDDENENDDEAVKHVGLFPKVGFSALLHQLVLRCLYGPSDQRRTQRLGTAMGKRGARGQY